MNLNPILHRKAKESARAEGRACARCGEDEFNHDRCEECSGEGCDYEDDPNSLFGTPIRVSCPYCSGSGLLCADGQLQEGTLIFHAFDGGEEA